LTGKALPGPIKTLIVKVLIGPVKALIVKRAASLGDRQSFDSQSFDRPSFDRPRLAALPDRPRLALIGPGKALKTLIGPGLLLYVALQKTLNSIDSLMHEPDHMISH
jgi:hypothetical protein